MLKAKNISLYKIMTAGYMTADVFRALAPNMHHLELNIEDCDGYPDHISQELKSCLKNEEVQEQLYFLEKLDALISSGQNEPFEFLDALLNNAETAVTYAINRIGKKAFLSEYIFSSPQSLRSRYYIDDSNIHSIANFIKQYEENIRGWLDPVYGEASDSEASENDLAYQDEILDSGFSESGYVQIDDDATLNPDDKKYVEFLCRLNEKKFEPFKVFIEKEARTLVRLQNGILRIGIRNFYVNYLYADETKLLKIPKLGKKSLSDFEKIVDNTRKFVNWCFDKKDTSEIEVWISNVNKEADKVQPLLKELISEVQYAELYKRLFELIDEHGDGPIVKIINKYNKDGDFIEDYVFKKGDLMRLSNVGKKKVQFLQPIIENIRNLIDEMLNNEPSEEELFFMDKDHLYGDALDEYSKKHKLEHGNLPMFHILENFISSLLKERYMKVLHLCFPFFVDDKVKTFNQASEDTGLTGSRVSGICQKQIKRFRYEPEAIDGDGLTYNKLLSQTGDWQYAINQLERKDVIYESDLRSLADEENCRLSNAILCHTAQSLLSDHFKHIGPELYDYCLKQEKSVWKHSYIITKSITACFDFDTLLKNIKKKETGKGVVNSRALDVVEIMDKFGVWLRYKMEIKKQVSEIVGQMLRKELGKIPDANNRFSIKMDKQPSPQDIIFGILEKRGEPMTIDDIYNANKRFFTKYKSIESISNLIRKDMRFCKVGKDKLIGLSEWGHKPSIGVREAIFAYLNSFNEPQPEANIVQYVQQIFHTSLASLRSSMQSGKQFIAFEGRLWGLKEKKYDSMFSVCVGEKRKTFKEWIEVFEQFLQSEGHFPRCKTESQDEKRLYSWWSRIKNQEKLNCEDKELLAQIIERYGNLYAATVKDEWGVMFSRYMEFIKQHKRKPRDVMNESELFNWYEKAKEDRRDDNLNPQQAKQLSELAKLI